MPQLYLIIFLFILLLGGCSGSNRSKLQLADALMEEKADSALRLLEGINKESLSKRDLPYFALLKTQAQVKTNVPLDSDSLVSIAYSKYADDLWGDKGIRANFYMGEVCYNQEKSREAMKHYLHALEEAKRLGNDYWRAKAADRIADLFFEAYNVEESSRYRKDAIESYERAEKPLDKQRAEYKLSYMLHYDGKITQAVAEIDSLMSLGGEQDVLDSLLLEYIDHDHMGAMMALCETYDKTNISTAILENSLASKDKIEGAIFRSTLLRMKERGKEADSLLIRAQAQANKNEDLVKILYSRYKNAREDGKLSYAAELADSVFGYQEAILSKIISESVNGAHSDFYSDLTSRTKQKSKWQLTISIIAFIAVCSVSFFSWRILRLRNRAQRAEIDAQIEALVSLKAYSDKLSAEKIAMSEEANQRENQQNAILQQLFKKNWTTLNMLCEEYYEKGGSQKIHDLVVKKIEKEVKNIGSEEGMSKIEEEVDKYMDGIVDKLRKECPYIKEPDIRFLTLIFAGFSAKAICFILGIQSGNFYVKKSRLFKKIKDSDAAHKESFLSQSS